MEEIAELREVKTMEFKGYKIQDEFSDSNRFKGVRVHLYNNKNGMYGFIEVGKEFDLWGLSGIEPENLNKETWKMLVEKAIDSYSDNSEYYVQKYSFDFVQGMNCGFTRRLPVD